MRVKLRYVLPMGQMVLAVALLWWFHVWSVAASRTADMPGTPPAFTLLIAINAPVALPRALWYRHISDFWDQIILIVAVGLLWYRVALNVDCWRKDKSVFIFAWKPLRFVGDLALIALGMFWAFLCMREDTLRSFGGAASGLFQPWLRTPFQIVVGAFLVIWSIALIYFFGRDFVRCILRGSQTNSD
jgi:hypothetical protein